LLLNWAHYYFIQFTSNCIFNGQQPFIDNGSDNQNFYFGWLQESQYGDDNNACELFYPNALFWPGMVKWQNSTQLRYPVININSLSCGATLLCGGTRPDVNPAGVPSMCGSDFDAYFEERVPKPDDFQFLGC
jgi:hypothetical protein